MRTSFSTSIFHCESISRTTPQFMQSKRNKRLESPLSTARLISQEAHCEQQKKQLRYMQRGGLGTSYHRVGRIRGSIGQGSQTQTIRQPGPGGRPPFVRGAIGCRHGNAEKREQ